MLKLYLNIVLIYDPSCETEDSYAHFISLCVNCLLIIYVSEKGNTKAKGSKLQVS